MSAGLLDHVRNLAMTLTPEEQLSLIGELASKLQGKVVSDEKKPFRSMRGALSDLGPAPSTEEMNAARREAWSGFASDES